MKLNYKELLPKFSIKKSSAISYGLKDLTGWYNIDFDIVLSNGKQLQRGYVWSELQKSELIKSIFKGNDIGVIQAVLYREDRPDINTKPIFKIVDGKQRLSTIFDFILGAFPITFEGKRYFFDDLVSDDEYINWFELVNYSGTPQDDEHLKYLKS